jgi:hypothetical protein
MLTVKKGGFMDKFTGRLTESVKYLKASIHKVLLALLAVFGYTTFIMLKDNWRDILGMLIRKILTSIHPQLPLYIFLVTLSCTVMIPTYEKLKELVQRLDGSSRQSDGKLSLPKTVKVIRVVLGEVPVSIIKSIKIALDQVKKVSSNVKMNVGQLIFIIKTVFAR